MFTITTETYEAIQTVIAETRRVLEAVYQDVQLAETDDPCLYYADIDNSKFDETKTITINLRIQAKASCGRSEMLDHIANLFALNAEPVIADAIYSCAAGYEKPRPIGKAA